jgi:hypothetical protein
MPLTKKGRQIMKSMVEEYGEEKGKEVFYASKNSGKITGVDEAPSVSYYASRLSDNLGETPEGYLVARDAVIGRTGWQAYQVNELPQDSLEELGVDASNQAASIEVYRSPEQVFDPATLASFEGKSVCDNHPQDEFVDPSNVTRFECGHVQNVRRGEAQLDSGEWPLIADIIIKREPLLTKVRDGNLRELSCGYDYVLARDGNKIVQTSIRGNHVAVVERGRAGAEARIKDSAPQPAPAEQSQSAGVGSTGEKRKEQHKVTNIVKHLLGLGLKAFAADAEPEKLAEAAEAVKSMDKARDEDPEAKKKEEEERKAAADKAARDAESEKSEKEKAEKDKKDAEERKKAEDSQRAKDAESDPEGKWKRMHEVLDMCRDKKAMDADLEELKTLLGEFFTEEEEEPDHAGDRATDGEPVVRLKLRGADGFIEPIPLDDDPGVQEIAAADTMRALSALKPLVARSNDRELKRAFNEQLGKLTRKAGSSAGTYADFADTSRNRGRSGDSAEDPEEARNRKLQKAYDQRRTGKKKEEVA